MILKLLGIKAKTSNVWIVAIFVILEIAIWGVVLFRVVPIIWNEATIDHWTILVAAYMIWRGLESRSK